MAQPFHDNGTPECENLKHVGSSLKKLNEEGFQRVIEQIEEKTRALNPRKNRQGPLIKAIVIIFKTGFILFALTKISGLSVCIRFQVDFKCCRDADPAKDQPYNVPLKLPSSSGIISEHVQSEGSIHIQKAGKNNFRSQPTIKVQNNMDLDLNDQRIEHVVQTISENADTYYREHFRSVCGMADEHACMTSSIKADLQKMKTDRIYFSDNRKAYQLALANTNCRSFEDPPGFDVKQIDSFIGEGVSTTKDFAAGVFLLEYKGDLVKNLRYARLLEKKYQEAGLGSFMYFFKYREQFMCVDATNDIFYQGRMINDAVKGDEKQNCEIKIVEVDMTQI